MKIRNGFVSNSSSSSFIVKLDKDIDEYTLEEFRALCYKNNSGFDPVSQLYHDLKNKEKSKRELYEWDFGYYGEDKKRQLEQNEYFVSYSDDNRNMSEMENDFMPDLPFVVEIHSCH